jgi:hypothetical protein
MPPRDPIDIARLDAWYGVRPGMRRAEVKAALEAQGFEVGEYGADNLTAMIDDWELECCLATDGSERLRQLAIEDEAVLWLGRPLVGIRLDEALRILQPLEAPQWTPQEAIPNPYPTLTEVPPESLSDESLLEAATVWLPQRCLGLAIYEGVVGGVIWRGAVDMPARYFGPVTEAQRELSLRPGLGEHLLEKRRQRTRREAKIEARKDPFYWLRRVVTLATILALAWVAKGGFETMKTWNQAPILTSKFIALEQQPYKQFRDFMPPELRWLFPKLRIVLEDAYRVEYLTPAGERREAVLPHAEVYISPRDPGTEVPIVYVEGDPPLVKGLAQARDSAFIEYTPIAIVIGTLWLAAQLLLSLLPTAGRIALPLFRRFIISRGTVKDPDRPELS